MWQSADGRSGGTDSQVTVDTTAGGTNMGGFTVSKPQEIEQRVDMSADGID